jgi:D-alanine--poly(phosphoribitol) ligase subunit 1
MPTRTDTALGDGDVFGVQSAWTLGDVSARGACLWPNELALTDGETRLTFAALHALVDHWAGRLQQLGVTRGARVAILGDKQVHTPIAILAVSRAGATYVPLDRNLPAKRLAFLLEDAAPALLIAPRTSAVEYEGVRVELESFAVPATEPCESRVASCAARSDDIAYIMYTSGSTGRPKGVQIEHRALRAFFHAHNDGARITAGDRCLNTGPFHFDVSIMDVFLPLYFGASVALAPELPLDKLLLGLLEEERITHFYAVGTVLALMTRDGSALDRFDLSHLTTLQTGAEVCNVHVVNQWLRRFPRLRMLNSYGPTEVAVGCLHYVKPEPGPLTECDVPIGVPHAGCDVRVVDEQGHELLTPGARGELLVGGDQLMRGYWLRPEEEARAFCEIEGRRFYRTGDIVYRDADGTFYYVGRRDDECKIDGHRIHLSELRRSLAACDELIASVVGTFRDREGKARIGLVAVPRQAANAALAQRVIDHLASELVAASVPRALLFCEALPRLSSDKADARACMQQLGHGDAPGANSFRVQNRSVVQL